MSKTLKDILIISLSTLVITFLIWLPFLLKVRFYNLDFTQGFSAIYKNYDGIEYIVIAKTFYNPKLLEAIPQPQPASYYPSHFPGFPLAIALFAPFLGFLKSMLFVSILFTILSAWAFYFLVKQFHLTNHPVWLSIVFLLLPARWIILHSVGSSEPMFIFFIIGTIYFLKKYEEMGQTKLIWLSAVSGALAQLTRPPGVLLFLSIGLYLLYHLLKERFSSEAIKAALRYYPFLLVPLTSLAIFDWFKLSLGDFWAYFHSGDNIHVMFPPFQVFNRYQFWVGDIWLEDIVYIFLLGLVGGIYLLKSKLQVAGFFVLTFLGAASLVAHRDIARYSLPIAPFIIIAFEKALCSKGFKIALALLLLALYLYSENFLIENTAPIPNLAVFN